MSRRHSRSTERSIVYTLKANDIAAARVPQAARRGRTERVNERDVLIVKNRSPAGVVYSAPVLGNFGDGMRMSW
jgi:hypothetical protein